MRRGGSGRRIGGFGVPGVGRAGVGPLPAEGRGLGCGEGCGLAGDPPGCTPKLVRPRCAPPALARVVMVLILLAVPAEFPVTVVPSALVGCAKSIKVTGLSRCGENGLENSGWGVNMDAELSRESGLVPATFDGAKLAADGGFFTAGSVWAAGVGDVLPPPKAKATPKTPAVTVNAM